MRLCWVLVMVQLISESGAGFYFVVVLVLQSQYADWLISKGLDRPDDCFQISFRSDFMKDFRVFVEAEMDL